MTTTRIAAAAALTIAALSPLSAQAQQDFRWSGRLASGQEIELRNLNGDIRAEPTSGSEVQVVGRRSGRDADEVEIRVVRQRDGMTICAVFPTSGNGRNRGDDGDECSRPGRRASRRNLDARVDFVVRVPAGVSLSANTVSGDVEAHGLRGPVAARSVSGDVSVATSGPAEASSVSGHVTAAFNRTNGGDLRFRSVSGDVTLRVPAGLDADFHARTVSGEIDSDLPVSSTRRGRSRGWVDVQVGEEVRGQWGRGGSTLSVETVSGDIRVERARR